MKFYNVDIDEALEKTDTSKEGITFEEAKRRLEEDGPNKLKDAKKDSKIVMFLGQFKNLMIVVLFMAAIVSFIIAYQNGESYLDSIIILLIVLILGYGFLFNDGNIKQLFLEGKNIFPIIKWQTIGDINKTLLEQNQPTIPGFDWMPVTLLPNIIMKDSLNPKDPNLYISLLIYLILIVLLFNISGCALTYFVRLKRGKLKSKEVFEKSLDNFNINNLDTPLSSTQPINNNLNQPIEIKKDDGN